MEKADKLEHYFNENGPFKEAMTHLRTLVNETELEEDWKWNFPTYTLNGKNVIGLACHKHHFGIWFFQGVFLKDTRNLLRNAQEGKTKALRSLHFESKNDINDNIVQEYIQEAIENSHAGKEVKIERNKKAVAIPEELLSAFAKVAALQPAFEALTPGKQREYAEHIGSAKQEATRLRRLDKCIPMIEQGIGLHDKYKNC